MAAVMKLYYCAQLSSLSAHIALRESGFPFELVRVDLETKKLAGGDDYLQVNPLGYVPVLELDDGQRLTEGPAILQYIADLSPAGELSPVAGTMGRYRLHEWLAFISSELHRTCASLNNPLYPDAVKIGLREQLGLRLDRVSSRLQGQDWLLGERFSVADGYLFTVLSWSPYLGIDLAPWPALEAFVERALRRPAVTEALRAEGVPA